MSPEAKRVIFDTDPGIGPGLDADDPLALLLILASNELDLQGVTTVFGNVDVRRATESALRVLEATGRTQVPVSQGMSISLNGVLHAESVAEYEKHAQRIGPINTGRVEAERSTEHAVDFMIRTVDEHPGEVTIIAVGPLTNVASAILKDPSFAGKVQALSIMGGAFGFDTEFGRGNITPVAEYNIWHDPLAASIVLGSGIPMTMVGLDVTNPNKGTVLYEDQLMELVGDDSPFSAFLYELCRNYIDAPRFDWTAGRKGCILYDPVAVAATIDPTLVETVHVPVLVETGGTHSAGQTIPVLRDEGGLEQRVDVSVDVDGERFIELFTSRLAALRDGLAS